MTRHEDKRERALWLADKLVGDYGSEAAQLLRHFAGTPSASASLNELVAGLAFAEGFLSEAAIDFGPTWQDVHRKVKAALDHLTATPSHEQPRVTVETFCAKCAKDIHGVRDIATQRVSVEDEALSLPSIHDLRDVVKLPEDSGTHIANLEKCYREARQIIVRLLDRVGGPYKVGEPESEDDSATVLDVMGNALTADEIVHTLNTLLRRIVILDDTAQTAARHRDEYRERAYAAEMKLEAAPANVAPTGKTTYACETEAGCHGREECKHGCEGIAARLWREQRGETPSSTRALDRLEQLIREYEGTGSVWATTIAEAKAALAAAPSAIGERNDG